MTNSDMNLPSVPTRLLTTPEELAELCQHIAAEGCFAFDTEFIGENSYRPVLCLVQVATRQRVELLDPFALKNLAPLWQLLADPAVEKICHAGDQDLAIAYQASGLTPANVFDAQIGAGMIGLGYPLAYWRVVEVFGSVSLEKAHTYSAWDRRPLSRDQFAYAVDDVRYLPSVHAGLSAKLVELGHAGWMRDACAALCREASTPFDPRMVYARLKGANQLEPAQLAILREVAALREQLAFEHNMTARQMLRDEVLLDLASRGPRRESELLAIRGMPREEVVTYGHEILAAIECGRRIPPDQRPVLAPPPDDDLETRRLAETLYAAAQTICLGRSLSPALVTSQAEVAAFARLVTHGEPLAGHPLMNGWQREALGQPLADFVAGKVKLAVSLDGRAMRTQFGT